MPRESIAPCYGACLKIVLFLLLLSQWHWWAVPPAAAQSLHCSPCALQELFPFSVPCFSISSWHPHPSSISFCSMGWLKALRDPFLVCGPVNKTVQYFGIFLLGLGGEGGGVECWRFPSWESTGIAAQWTKLRGKLEVPQNSVQIQLHTLKIEGGKNVSGFVLRLLLCILFNEKIRKLSLQVVEPCDLANVCVWNPVYLAFQILML